MSLVDSGAKLGRPWRAKQGFAWGRSAASQRTMHATSGARSAATEERPWIDSNQGQSDTTLGSDGTADGTTQRTRDGRVVR